MHKMGFREVFTCIASVCLWSSARAALESKDVFMMVRGLHEALLEQTCSVIGASTDEECSSFNFTRSQYLSPAQIAFALDHPERDLPLFTLSKMNASALLDRWVADLRPTLSEKANLVENIVATVENLYEEDQDAFKLGLAFLNETKSGNEQVGWRAEIPASGNFAGLPVNMEACAFHIPSTAPLDRRRTNSDAVMMNQMCNFFKQNWEMHADMGIRFQSLSSIHGVTSEYPGTVRGLSYDNRFEVWFKRSIFPAKDVVVVVDQSGSMDGNRKCGAMAFASAQVHALVHTWVTPRDQFQLLLVADEAHVSPCAEGSLVPGSPSNLAEILEWFRTESAIRRGQGSLANGVLEALNILESAKDSGTSSGGAKFIIVLSDALEIQDIIEEGIKKHANDQIRPLSLPIPGLHLIGASVGSTEGQSKLDESTCEQRGLAWKVFSPPEATGLDCPINFKQVTTSQEGESFSIDTRFLLNVTTLLSLSAWPWSTGDDLVQWGPVRGGVVADRLRRIMSIGKLYFDRRTSPPKLRGAAGLEFFIDEVLEIMLEWDKPELAHALLVQYRDDVGMCLVHSLYPPSYSDYVDEQIADGDLDIRVEDLEGPNFEASGTLSRIAQSESGYSVVNRELVVESNGYVRPVQTLTTYWWRHIPKSAFALVVALEGRPATEDSMLVPSLSHPSRCPPNVTQPHGIETASPYGCWMAKDQGWPTGYHRFDLAVMRETNSSNVTFAATPARFSSPWGGTTACAARMCTWDSSAWLGLPAAWKSSGEFLRTDATLETVQNLDTLIMADTWQPETAFATLGVASQEVAEGLVPGKGLKSHAAADVKISANMELFWKEVMGVQWSGETGQPTELNMDEENVNRRFDILQLFFLSTAGVMRFYPGSWMEDKGRNYMKESWYARAISVPELISVSSPRWVADDFNATWAVTVSKAALHTPSAEEERQGIKGITFGVVGAHYRLSGFARLFRRATSLQSIFKYGCGDMGTSAAADDGFACFLLNERSRIVMDRELLLLGDQRPDEITSSPSAKELYQEEPLLMEYLMTASAITSERLQYGINEHFQYKVNVTALEEWTQDKRESAMRAGLPLPEYTGIELNVRGEGSFGGYKIWFYQIPNFNLYMLAVTGYEPLSQKPYCGYLSLTCPSVFQPIRSVNKQSSCEAPVPRHTLPGDAYQGPSEDDLARMRTWPTGEQGFELACPAPIPIWLWVLIVLVCIVLGISALVSLHIWRKHRHKLQSTRNFMQKQAWEAHGAESTTTGFVAIEADTKYYVKIGEKQQQLAEDLSQRDEGDGQANNKELLAIGEEISGMLEQMDYLQQRMQKQEALTSKFDHFRRKALSLCTHASDLAQKVDVQKRDGALPALDQNSEEALKAAMEKELLPPGTREQLFHRMYLPRVATMSTPRQQSPSVNAQRRTATPRSSKRNGSARSTPRNAIMTSTPPGPRNGETVDGRHPSPPRNGDADRPPTQT